MQLGDNANLAIEALQMNPLGAQKWLSRHCESAPSKQGVRISEAIVLWRHDSNMLPVALWPKTADGQGLLSLADDVRLFGRGMITDLPEGNIAAGYPIRELAADDALAFDEGSRGVDEPVLLGVAVLELEVSRSTDDSQSDQQDQIMFLMQRLEEGIAVLERDALLQQHMKLRVHNNELSEHLDLLASVLAENRFNPACMKLATRLAASLDAERVSLGWRKQTRTKIVQISNSAKFHRKMNRVRATELAMDESLDQLASVVFPGFSKEEADTPPHRVVRAHQTLSELTGFDAVATIPLLDEGRPLGALTIERTIPFTHREIAALESLSALCARALEEKRLNDRALPVKLFAAFREQLVRLFGVGYLGYKLTFSIVASLIAFGFLANGADRVTADATLESSEQRVIAAPYRGYIDHSRVRAGDRVVSGQVLATMDIRELTLERLQWQSELAKYSRQEQEMRATGDLPALNVLSAQRDQTNANLSLVESRLDRSTLSSPFDGVVVSGDLTQRLGGVVEQGEELFRISPLEGFRVELEVPERRIDDIEVGQQGELVLSAVSGMSFPFEIELITPQTRSSDGSTRFVVEATFLDDSLVFRPGMQGVGKVDVGEDRLIALWTDELRHWLRLNIWRWWG